MVRPNASLDLVYTFFLVLDLPWPCSGLVLVLV